MIPRWLTPQVAIAVAVTLLLLALLAQADQTRRWRAQSVRFEQLYLAEQKARARIIADYRAAAELARQRDAANAARVAAEQKLINERIIHDLETRLADARARAERLQLGQRQAAAGGGARPAPVPAGRAAPGPARPAPAQDRLSLADRLIATEQAIQLDELIRWVKAQSAVQTSRD
jgi:hypothetical protein